MDNWSRDSTLQLIELYRKHSFLWNPQTINYFNKKAKDEAWKEISAELGEDEQVCKRKINSLLASYRREKSKSRKFNGESQGRYNSRWFAYDSLQFLEVREWPQKRDTDIVILRPASKRKKSSHEKDLATDTRADSENELEIEQESEQIEIISFANQEDGNIADIHTSNKLNKSTTRENEVEFFGQFIISKMSSYSQKTKLGVQHAIFEILVKADSGFYE